MFANFQTLIVTAAQQDWNRTVSPTRPVLVDRHFWLFIPHLDLQPRMQGERNPSSPGVAWGANKAEPISTSRRQDFTPYRYSVATSPLPGTLSLVEHAKRHLLERHRPRPGFALLRVPGKSSIDVLKQDSGGLDSRAAKPCRDENPCFSLFMFLSPRSSSFIMHVVSL